MSEDLIVDPDKFKELLKKRGYRSISHLAKASGVHRNTITEYLSLRSSPFQTTFIKLAKSLRVNPMDLFSDNPHYENAKIMSVIGTLLEEFLVQNTSLCVVLLSSIEDEKTLKPEIKLGFTNGEHKLGNAEFSIYKVRLEDYVSRRRVKVECVNLDRVSSSFLMDYPDTSRVLVGNQESYRYTLGFIRGLKIAGSQKKDHSFDRDIID